MQGLRPALVHSKRLRTPVFETESKSAQKAVSMVVASAVAALEGLKVGVQDVTEIIERRVVEAAQLIRKVAKE
jgi:hypothetical protein